MLNIQLKYNLKLNFNTSIGVFLFILFFQPFNVTYENVNNLIIFFSGFAGIIFILNNLILIALPAIFPKTLKIGWWEVGPPFLLNALMLALNSVAFTFYLRYVGGTKLSFYIVFQIVLIVLSLIIIIRLVFIIRFQRHHIDLLKNKLNEIKPAHIETTDTSNIIELYSENNAEKVKLNNQSIYTIKAADNYVEIHFKENGNFQKKLLRNTLKNIETQLVKHPNYIRCHRTFMVNLNHVTKLIRNYNGHQLILTNTEEIPVSRHYLLKVKEKMDEK